MNKEQIELKIKQLESDLKTAEINFHRLSGAIALLQDMLKDIPKEPNGTDTKQDS